MNTSSYQTTYKEAGVDIKAGNALVERIKPLTKSTHRTGVLGNLGGFGALFELPLNKYTNPVLVSGTDGVGTKLKLAVEMNKHATIGIDLVAMCVNDIIVTGAEPLYFLDYYATSKLNVDTAASVISGIVEGCKQAGCALTGGETAEMPGIYQDKDYDLAGFCVGIVEKSKIIQPTHIQADDILIALPSSGLHSNGYSLVRKILEDTSMTIRTHPSISKADLLMPTRIYVKTIQSLLQKFNSEIHGIAHITGGGITENVPRILPNHLSAQINLKSWTLPSIFQTLATAGGLTQTELLKTLNCGVGMILAVAQSKVSSILSHLHSEGEKAWIIGRIIPTISSSQKNEEPSSCVTYVS